MMQQLAFELLDFSRAIEFPAARRLDPETSKAAAASAKDLQAEHVRKILSALERFGSMGKDSIARHANLSPVQVARRCGEMRKCGLLTAGSGATSDAGRAETLWGLA